LRAGLGLPF